MLSPFQQQPHLRLFLPIICLVWSDTVLSEKEMSVVRGFIKRDKELHDDEKAVLLSLVNPSNPPPQSLFKEWLDEIQTVAARLPRSSTHMSDLCLAMVPNLVNKLYHLEITALRNELGIIEKELGLIGPEAVFLFYPEGRKTLTQSLSSQTNFPVEKLYQVLSG